MADIAPVAGVAKNAPIWLAQIICSWEEQSYGSAQKSTPPYIQIFPVEDIRSALTHNLIWKKMNKYGERNMEKEIWRKK